MKNWKHIPPLVPIQPLPLLLIACFLSPPTSIESLRDFMDDYPTANSKFLLTLGTPLRVLQKTSPILTLYTRPFCTVYSSLPLFYLTNRISLMSKHSQDFHMEPHRSPSQRLGPLPFDAESLNAFDAIIDVRSPAEFAEDHIYGAVNYPALNNEERVEVGTLYKHNPFEARKLGAAYIARNMSEYLQKCLKNHKKYWNPLVYCWRGGMRSSSVVHIMQEVGWPARQLQGGYKAYRQYILAQLETLPQALRFIVLCGPTGSGKSRLLHALAKNEHQILDLEALAKHRGSLLGLLPGEAQPSQRFFETQLYEQLRHFSPHKPVFIESESRRIGHLSLPPDLFQKMQESPCLQIEVPFDERVRFLCEDYICYINNPQLLRDKITRLAPYHSKAVLQNWFAFIDNEEYPQLVEGLLKEHYDPLYWRSTHKHHNGIDSSPKITLESLDEAHLELAEKEFARLSLEDL